MVKRSPQGKSTPGNKLVLASKFEGKDSGGYKSGAICEIFGVFYRLGEGEERSALRNVFEATTRYFSFRGGKGLIGLCVCVCNNNGFFGLFCVWLVDTSAPSCPFSF